MFFILFYFILFSPLVASAILGLRLFRNETILIFYSCILLFCNLQFSFFFFFFCFYFGPIYNIYTLGNWFLTNYFVISWIFVLDIKTIIMFFIVNLISLLVHFYSIGYMNNDPNFLKFFSYLLLFTFFMLFLVSSGNLLQLFIGWEGVGLCSFLLISFWQTRLLANKAALKAMIINKFGDFFILIGFCYLLELISSLNFFDVLNFFFFESKFFIFFLGAWSYIDWICFFFFLGIMAKSAQFGLHSWLPDAMEGPTPVSALIHAATMVTAGVFLLIRLNFLFFLSSFIQIFIVLTGTLTILFAALVAVFQNDLKRIIAYSTCSQLGYMIMACGFCFFNAAFFHLVMHAFFKALLFLCAGSIIHSLSDEQDIRKMGGLYFKLPITFFAMLIGNLALIGFPFTSGYYSKDAILELVVQQQVLPIQLSFFSYIIGLFSVFLTSFYSFRLLFLVFFTTPRGYKQIYAKIPVNSYYILIPLCILSFFSLGAGVFSCDFFFSLPIYNNFFSLEHISWFLKIFPLFLIFLSFCFCYFIYIKKVFFFSKIFFSKNFYLTLYWFFNKKWFLDYFDKIFYGNIIFLYSYILFFNKIEKGWLEYLGPFGFYIFFKKLSFLVHTISNVNLYVLLRYFIILSLFSIILIL